MYVLWFIGNVHQVQGQGEGKVWALLGSLIKRATALAQMFWQGQEPIATPHALCRIMSPLSSNKQSPLLCCKKPISSSRPTGSLASSQPQTKGSGFSQPTVSEERSSSGNPLGSTWPRLTPWLPHSPAPRGSQMESQAPHPQPSAAARQCQWLYNRAWPGPAGDRRGALGALQPIMPAETRLNVMSLLSFFRAFLFFCFQQNSPKKMGMTKAAKCSYSKML